MAGRAPGVLFDVDGTLLDTNYLHVLAWTRALRRCGYADIGMADVHRAIGIDSAGLVHRLTGAGSEDGDSSELTDAHSQEYQELRAEVRAFPLAGELVRRCHDAGLTVVLATSGRAADLDWMLPAIGAEDAITGAVTADDVSQGKPSPDLQSTAMTKFGLDPDRTVAVGDTVWDIESAGRAGLSCLALECGGIAREALESAGARHVYHDPADLFNGFDDSILSGSARA
jgi:HAD superfamily hydrolase (TIGR01509 family)